MKFVNGLIVQTTAYQPLHCLPGCLTAYQALH